MRTDLQELKDQLKEICNKEALRLWRQARRMKAHNVSMDDVNECSQEAFELWNTGYPERILDDVYSYSKKYAFK